MSGRRFAIGGVAVFACAALLRLPFGSSYLWAWDSVLYARAIEHFAVDLGRPHPPGYLFYVLAARLAAWLLGDANAGLVLVSVLSGALTCAAGFWIGGRLVGVATGVLTAAILVANPVLWEYSEVAYPYATLALLSGTVGALLWSARRGAPARLVLASLALGLAAGFRQDLLLLGPLWLYVVARRGWRTAIAASAGVAVGCLAWLIPTAAQSGGIERYLEAVLTQFVSMSTLSDPNLEMFSRNAQSTLVGLRSQVLWTWPLLLAGLWAVVRGKSLPPALLVLWVGPPLAVYVLFHIGEPAYTLSVAMPLALLAGTGAVWLLGRSPGRRRALTALGIAALLVLDAGSFVIGTGRFSLHEIAHHDRILAVQIAYVRTHFAPNETVLVAQGNYPHAAYYLPEYGAVYLPQGRAAVRLVAAAPGARWVVLFGGEGRVSQRPRVTRVVLATDVDLRLLRLQPGEWLLAEGEILSLAGP